MRNTTIMIILFHSLLYSDFYSILKMLILNILDGVPHIDTSTKINIPYTQLKSKVYNL